MSGWGTGGSASRRSPTAPYHRCFAPRTSTRCLSATYGNAMHFDLREGEKTLFSCTAGSRLAISKPYEFFTQNLATITRRWKWNRASSKPTLPPQKDVNSYIASCHYIPWVCPMERWSGPRIHWRLLTQTIFEAKWSIHVGHSPLLGSIAGTSANKPIPARLSQLGPQVYGMSGYPYLTAHRR